MYRSRFQKECHCSSKLQLIFEFDFKILLPFLLKMCWPRSVRGFQQFTSFWSPFAVRVQVKQVHACIKWLIAFLSSSTQVSLLKWSAGNEYTLGCASSLKNVTKHRQRRLNEFLEWQSSKSLWFGQIFYETFCRLCHDNHLFGIRFVEHIIFHWVSGHELFYTPILGAPPLIKKERTFFLHRHFCKTHKADECRLSPTMKRVRWEIIVNSVFEMCIQKLCPKLQLKGCNIVYDRLHDVQ